MEKRKIDEVSKKGKGEKLKILKESGRWGSEGIRGIAPGPHGALTERSSSVVIVSDCVADVQDTASVWSLYAASTCRC